MLNAQAIFEQHLTRVKTAVDNTFSLASIPEWIERNTKIGGENFSFKDHEYQLAVLRDQSREIVVRKCSQIGLTELSVRYALAMMRIIDGLTCIYTLPTAGFASNFSKTRIDPVVSSSDDLSFAVNPNLDNTEIKQFGMSFLYLKGTIGTSAAISVPSDLNIHDEFDFSDLENLSNYESRLTHSKYKMRREFSTPTVEGYGISASFEKSRRHWNFCKCHHCNEWFLPNYFDHVKVPGFDGDLRTINSSNLHLYRWKEAFLICPHCGRLPSLAPEYRNWVIENPTENHESAGYQIQPFDAPAIITPSYLVERSTKYKRYADFINFNLGLPAADRENALSKEELERTILKGDFPGFPIHVMGIDMGLTCHFHILGADATGNAYIVHVERVPLAQFARRKQEMTIQFRVAMTVMDSQPYVDTVLRLQETDPNLFGAVYSVNKKIEIFTITNKEENEALGKLPLKQVMINRNSAFDDLVSFLRSGRLIKRSCDEDEIWMKHCMDMKRVQVFGADQEMQFVWKKSDKGNDHYFHSLLYAYVALRLRGVSINTNPLPFTLGTFRVKSLN